ncbi:MAG: VWA domain-containing protein [Polyangiales bacterium]
MRVLAFVPFLLLAACSAGSGQTDLGGTGGDDASVGDGSNDETTISLGCKPECPATQICSTTNVCIDKGTCAGDGDCPAGMTCDATKKCVPGGACGSEHATATAIPPNLLIVLDRSCSMKSKVGTQTKWQIAVKALSDLATKFGVKIRFGLTMFPDTDMAQCAQGAIPIAPGPGNDAKITKILNDSLVTTDPNYPDGPCVTNIDTAVQQAQKCPELADKTRQDFAILMTDGAQAGCSAAGGAAGAEKIITDMATAGVKTFVIGFGGGVDAASLNKFATAGGVPATGATKYYDAADGPALAAALDIIAKAALGCTYTLDKTPPDPSKIFVFFDSKDVAKDGTNGWSYDPTTNTVTFHGTSCDQIKSETVKTVDIVLGCKSSTK